MRYQRNRHARVQQLIPIAAARVLQNAIESLKEGLCDRPDQCGMERPAHLHESTLSRLNKVKREYTCTFQNPLSKYFYTALTPYEFETINCSWIGADSNCYVLCTNFLEECFVRFKLSSIQDLNESDDEAPRYLPAGSRTTSRNIEVQNHQSNLDNILQCNDDFDDDDDYI